MSEAAGFWQKYKPVIVPLAAITALAIRVNHSGMDNQSGIPEITSLC
jgi:hypothetical protein